MITPLEAALKEFGNKEVTGLLHNAEVVKYFKQIGATYIKDDETAWCAAFVYWCLMKAGRMYDKKLNARSFLNYGVSTKKPAVGDIVVLWRVAKASPYGHVGFFIRELNGFIYILGGNQSDQVNISAFPVTQLLDYRKIPLVTHA